MRTFAKFDDIFVIEFDIFGYYLFNMFKNIEFLLSSKSDSCIKNESDRTVLGKFICRQTLST